MSCWYLCNLDCNLANELINLGSFSSDHIERKMKRNSNFLGYLKIFKTGIYRVLKYLNIRLGKQCRLDQTVFKELCLW